MKHRKRHVALAALLVAVLVAPAATAQTTGQILGTVTDPQGGAVPGATVTATSPALQGARMAVTDNSGTYRFPTLPPGSYAIKVEMVGFQAAEQTNVPVSLSQAVTVNLKLQIAGVASEVLVLGASPYVDTTTSSGGISVSGELFTQLPIARDFYAISRLAPGVTQDAVGPAALGSTGAENQYIIEGLNMTSIVAGQQARAINFDFI